ncbi:MAG: MBL fold metallo-hydrolase [Candidatus Kariarchaeaceae archaeon]|jgi:glyoxylase-like metal-dependent hydrolase (beta-lactamase superfamily II)
MQKIGNSSYMLDVNGKCALLTSNRLILIDTGTQPDAADLLNEIHLTGYKSSDIESIIITHTHPDHVGGLATLKEMSGAKIAAHEVEADFISKKRIYQGPPGPETQHHPGTPIDVILKDGQSYEGLLVIHTPGHTPGHISLLDKDLELMIAGDALRNDPSGLGPMADMYTLDPKQHRESIKKLGNYNFKHLIVGHGDPVENLGKDMLNTLITSGSLE